MTDTDYEFVNHPPHYNAGGIEAIEVIAAWNLGFWMGSIVKYIARLGRKPGATELQDLKKVQWYVNDAVARLEAGQEIRP